MSTERAALVPVVGPPGLEPAPRAMLRDTVYESLKALLMDHDLEPGEKLSIDGLARQLQVSATPVRESLSRLESDGLVVKRANTGYTVTPILDSRSFEDMCEIRLLLEPPAAAKAARRASDDEIENMRRIVVAMQPVGSGDRYAAYRRFAALDTQFHDAVATTAGNPLLTEALRRLHAHTHGFRLYYRHGIAATALSEHAEVMDAVAARNPRGAEVAMRRHLVASRKRLREAFAS